MIWRRFVSAGWTNSSFPLGSGRQEQKKTRGFRLFPAVLSILLGWVTMAHAQVTGTIKGQITDPSGAAVPSANITIINSETDISRVTTSDTSGNYLVLALPVGNYKVKAAKAGFQESTRSGIELNVGQEVSVDLRLELSAVKAAVTVSEDAPIVNTTTSDISGLVGA